MIKEIEVLKGLVFYCGIWDGYIINGEIFYIVFVINKSIGDIVEFMVNFDNKILIGELKKVGSFNIVFDINGKLDGNSFSGMVLIKGDGFVFDIKNMLDFIKVCINIEVKGVFYGVKGFELGGVFSVNILDDSNKVKVVVVFGVKC